MDSFNQTIIDFENILKERIKISEDNYIYYLLKDDRKLVEIAKLVKKKDGRTVTISVVNKGIEYSLNYVFCIYEKIIINIEIKIKEEKVKSLSSILKCSTFFQDEIYNKYKIKFIEENSIKIIEKRIGNFDIKKNSLDDIADFTYETKNEIIKNVHIDVSKTISMPLKNINYLNRFYAYSTNNNSLIYALAMEEIAKIDTSRKIKLIRVIADELIRATSHLFNFSLLTHYLNSSDLMQKTLKIREVLQDIKEILWGSRLDISINIIGGVNFDIDEVKRRKALEKIEIIKKKFEVFYKIVENDESLNQILNFGKISKEKVLEYSLVGPVARASSVNNDVRSTNSYLLYEELGFDVKVRKNQDAYSRVFVRLDEVYESIRLINMSLEILPDKCIEKIKRIDIPKGESTIRIEAARGELFYYLRSEGSNLVSRIITRTPTTMNWQMLKEIIPNNSIDQMPLLLNSIDPCVSCSLEI